MTKTQKRTEKCCYPSRYSPQGYVHAAQYITELICEKKAKTAGDELPVRFWKLPEWLKFYKYQIMLANRLLKKYGEHAVIAALQDKRTFKTYSLRSPWLEKIIAEYVKKTELARQLAKEVEYDFTEKQTFDSKNNKKSIVSKLKELE